MLADNFRTDFRVFLNDFEFLRSQLARLEQDMVGNADLADVVHHGGVHQQFRLRLQKTGCQPQQFAEIAHPHDMHAGFVVTIIGRTPQLLEHDQMRLLQLPVAALQLPGALRHHLLQAVALVGQGQMRPDAGAHDGRTGRFDDVVRRPQLETQHFILGLAQRGDKNDRDMPGRLVSLDLAADFIAVHAGHHDIEQDQVGRLRRHYFHRQLAAVGNFYRVVRTQYAAQHIDVLGRIVHDQQGAFFNVAHVFSLARRWASASAFS